MYTVKITGPGTITFRQRPVRVPATFKKVSVKELKILKVMCKAHNLTYEVLEEESERLARVAEKIRHDEEVIDVDSAIDGTETTVEELFESADTLEKLMGDLGKE